MVSSFEALFGRNYGDCRLQDLPKLAQSARESPGTWVTAQCQHRWLVIARALQGHNRSTKSALNSDTQLWDMLAKVTDSVGLLFEGMPRHNCNLYVLIKQCCEHTISNDVSIPLSNIVSTPLSNIVSIALSINNSID